MRDRISLLNRLLGVPLLTVALGCGEAAGVPAVGFTYTFGPSPVDSVLQEEVDLAGGAGADSVRLLISPEGGFKVFAAAVLPAEVARAAWLVDNPEVLAVVGPGGSREALQVAPLYEAAGLADLVPTATSRALATAGHTTLPISPNDSVQGAFIAAFADSALRARRAAIIYVADEYGIGLAAGTAAEFHARGIEEVARVPLSTWRACTGVDGPAYYATIAQSLKRQGPLDVVVLASRTQEAVCAARALRQELPALHLLAGDGVYVDEAVIRNWGPATERLFLVAFWHPSQADSASQAFTARFRAATGLTPRHGDAVFRDAAVLAATAIREGGRSREAVLAYLRSLGVTREPFQGITGPIAFVPGIQRPLLMTQVRNGESILLGAR
ncbi:MAG: ABC transporter substrate-binding protein [Gemmatimonadaceae bacterium]|nr:ABC transporter substrate-binding protein [Gemmatimonadaceae bacterium]